MTRILILVTFVVALSACGQALRKPQADTYNMRMLKEQNERIARGENPYGYENPDATGDPKHSSLWAKSVGSPYIIRNQKAQKVGDLLTIVISEEATASTSANTDVSKESDIEVSANLSRGQSSLEQIGTLGFNSGNSSEFEGEGSTDRTGKLQTTVQAVVENVLENGTLFVRGQKIVTINEEDQVIEITGFVRRDDIRINNTVASSLLADAEVRYVGAGVISDKNHVGWGMRILDWVWPF